MYGTICCSFIANDYSTPKQFMLNFVDYIFYVFKICTLLNMDNFPCCKHFNILCKQIPAIAVS
jgi:hypothetical protein